MYFIFRLYLVVHQKMFYTVLLSEMIHEENTNIVAKNMGLLIYPSPIFAVAVVTFCVIEFRTQILI